MSRLSTRRRWRWASSAADLADGDPVRDLRLGGPQQRVPAAERVQAHALDRDQDRRARPEHHEGGALPGDHLRADLHRHGLRRQAHGRQAQPRADRRRGRLRPDLQPDRQEQHGRPDGGQVVPVHRHDLLLHPVLEPDRLHPAAGEHRAPDPHLRPRAAGVRDLRGHRQPLDAADPHADRVALLPHRGHPGQGLLRLPQGLDPGGRERLRTLPDLR